MWRRLGLGGPLGPVQQPACLPSALLLAGWTWLLAPCATSSRKQLHHQTSPLPPPPPTPQVETLEVMLAPMARAAADPLGSMGNDAPLAHMRCGPRPSGPPAC